MEFGIKGIVKVTVAEADGSVVSENIIDNIETNYALAALAKWLSGVPTNSVLPPTKIGAGNGTGTVSANDTALWAAISGTLKNCDSIMFTQGYYAQYNLTYQTSDPAGYYNELGLFDASGNMFAHVAINQFKTSAQTLSVQWMLFTTSDNSGGGAVSNYARAAFSKWLTGVSNVSGQTGAVVPPSQFRLGVGTGQVSSSDLGLFSQISGTTKAVASVQLVQNSKVQFSVIYTDSDPSGQFNEIGLFDTAGNIWVHSLISSNRQSGYVMPAVCQVTIAQG